MSITVGYSRGLLQVTARNGGVAAYSPTILDMYLKTAFQQMLERTQLGYTTITQATTANTYTYDLSSTTFLDSRFVYAMIGNKVLKSPDFPTLARYYDTTINPVAPVGEPTSVAFYNHNQMYVYPNPDAVYSIELTYKAPLIAWTEGATDGTTTAVVINLPEEAARQCVVYGAAYYLESSDKEMAASTSARFKEWTDSLAYWQSRANQNQGSLIITPSLSWSNQSSYYNTVPGM